MIDPFYETKLGKLYLGDAKDVLPQLEESNVDLVLTDPPYTKEYLYTYGYLADLCPRVMKDHSSLITIAPHYALDQVIGVLGKTLSWRWIIAMLQHKRHAIMNAGFYVSWKPNLWFTKGKLAYKGFVKDSFVVGGNDDTSKSYHRWGQDVSWAEFFIRQLTKPNDLVLDPFVGGGTVAVVSENQPRRWIAIEIEKGCGEETVMRLEQVPKWLGEVL